MFQDPGLNYQMQSDAFTTQLMSLAKMHIDLKQVQIWPINN